MTTSTAENRTLHDRVESYWNERIHDLEMTENPVGTPGFFDDLEEYRFDKLSYLPEVVDFNGYAGKKVLEVGCGLGLDLARFAKGGAEVTGIDLSQTAIDLARKHFEQRGQKGTLEVMSGHDMSAFADDTFDMVYCHGTLPYAADAADLATECHRVLKPGGQGIFMNYNSRSWLSFMTKVTKVGLEHDDAPVFAPRTAGELRKVLGAFDKVTIRGERFPAHSRLHGGWKGFLYNRVFVPCFNLTPRFLIRPLGWHLMAYCEK